MDKTTIIIPEIGASQPVCVESSLSSLSSSNYVSAQNRRKEKARIAARARRSQEASIIMEMANELHITQEKIKRIDKATIVKLAIDYIKAFDILCRFRCSCCSNQAATTNYSTATTITTTAPIITTNDQTTINASNCITNDENIITETNDNIQATNTSDHQYQYHDIITQHKRNRSNSIIIPSKQLREKALTARLTAFDDQPSMPKLSTASIFAPKTDEMDSHFLMINERDGTRSFVLKPDNEILDEDDLTHLAPQAGDISISLEVEPLDGIVLDTGLFTSDSPPPKKAPIGSLMAKKMLERTCYVGTVD